MLHNTSFHISALTHIMQICHDFDIANLLRYCAGFAPMLFQWSHSHMQHFSLQIPDKNCAIKRGLERKNRAIKKSRYVCQGTYLPKPLVSTCALVYIYRPNIPLHLAVKLIFCTIGVFMLLSKDFITIRTKRSIYMNVFILIGLIPIIVVVVLLAIV